MCKILIYDGYINRAFTVTLFRVIFKVYHFLNNRCPEFYEGPNCEFSLMNSIYYDEDEIPGKLMFNIT